MTESVRYSSTFTGEALSQSAKVWRSSAVRPARLATNQSAASWVMSPRTRSSFVLINSPQPRHATPAVHKRLAQVLLDHVCRDVEPLRDFLVAQSVPVLQHHRSAAFRRQLMQYFA